MKPTLSANRKPVDGFPQSRNSAAPLRSFPPSAPPRIWKFWGTALWGLFIFAAMFVGQIAVVAWFVLRQDGPIDMAAAIHVVGGGLTISLSVIMGLPAVLAALWLAIRPSRTPFADYLALRWTSWSNFVIGVVALVVLVMGWDLLSRATGREVDAGLHGRRAEIGARRRRAVAAGDRVLRRRADLGGIVRARLSLPRLVGIVSQGPPAPSCCRRWCGRRCICNMTGSSSARCFRSACCSVISAIAAIRPG